MNMHEKVENADFAAIDYAWLQLQHTPFDGGMTRIEFDPMDRWVPDRDDNGDPIMNPRFPDLAMGRHVRDGFSGERRASTEEGHDNVNVRVRPLTDDGDEWIVEVGTDSRDCDGRYTGGWDVTFKNGEVPVYDNQERRDHTAEAAGY